MYAADLQHGSQSLQKKLHALYNLSPHKKVAPGFRPQFLKLLQAFGNPHQKLPPTIHIAGTNGKGSTLAMLRSMLEAQGYKVHAYTSPHLIQFNERIYLAGKNITDDALEALIDRALELNAGMDTTFFEITTAMSFAAFAETPADLFLCETGLGGRLDCTNIIEHPIATLITTISYDHQQFLGDTLEQIAFEKAGIMKPGTPCILGTQEHPEALATLQRIAAEKNIDLVSYQIVPIPSVTPNLLGDHQILNARAARATLQVIEKQFPVNEAAIQKGLKHIHWPARLQQMPAYKNFELWYDGGHNESAAKVLATQAQHWRQQDNLPLHIIVGLKADKDAGAFIQHLSPFAKSITLIDVPGVTSVQNLADTAFTRADTISSALNGMKGDQGRILICGSLYLAGPLAKALA